MTHIVAAHVGTQDRGESLRQALLGRGVPADHIEVFTLTDAGRHARYPIGGDRAVDPASQDSASGAAKGVVAGGVLGAVAGVAAAAAAPVVAPAIIAGMTGAGAFGGSLAGAMRETDAPPPAQDVNAARTADTRRGGVMVAVNVGAPEQGATVVDCMRAHGAEQIERADGQWRDGGWADFDPLSAPRWVDAAGSASGGSSDSASDRASDGASDRAPGERPHATPTAR